MIKSDPDAPEITDAQARNPMSFSEAMKRGPDRPRLHNAKKAVTLRLDSEIVQRFKAKGDDWRIRMAKVRKDAS
ncbi:BrnA antitoxin family protein [Pelagibacterium mangrovi]|uniref:BrnA antitoxin family protein n=1 Tax=Pelagibacterium mangrovi TaxID=3119828 RepID=UPI002FC5E2E4